MIYNLNEEVSFKEQDLSEVLNLIESITSKHEPIIRRINSRNIITDDDQEQLNIEISRWTGKIRRLGLIPLSLYQVKINTTESFIIWNFSRR